jgi:hydroxymethylglutaryl-CoA lyase
MCNMDAPAGADVELVEVGPRDGLQTLALPISTSTKVALIERLVCAGVRRIEVASFVDPRRVPTMADAERLLRTLPRGRATYVGIALNERGARRALSAGVDELGTVCAASDAFGMANQGATSQDSVVRACRMIALARSFGIPAQATISVAFGCPYAGDVAHGHVVGMARTLAAAGAREVAVADTIGVATPSDVERLCLVVQAAIAPVPVRAHFHDTRGAGIANVWGAYRAGVRIIDASIAGLGGCPFAPGAAGNVATEHVAHLFARSGVSAGVSQADLATTAAWLKLEVAQLQVAQTSAGALAGAAS